MATTDELQQALQTDDIPAAARGMPSPKGLEMINGALPKKSPSTLKSRGMIAPTTDSVGVRD